MAYSHKTGEVVEVRKLTEIGGHADDIQTRHKYRCRIRWSGGDEGFHDFSGDYSPGDKVMVIYDGRVPVEEHNLTTKHFWPVLRPNSSGGLALFFFIAAIFVFGAGVATLLMGGNVLMSIVLMGVGVAIWAFLRSGTKREETARRTYRAKALASIG